LPELLLYTILATGNTTRFMKHYIRLIRPRDWAKNAFLFIPVFFSQHFFEVTRLEHIIAGFFAFSFVASTIYILNDYRDIEQDRNHPIKRKRPLAAGTVKPGVALLLATLLVSAGFALAYYADPSFRFITILGFYLVLNIAYSLGLKNISILDIMIIAAGFVLRLKAGGYIAQVEVSAWLTLMTLLLALFMAIAKRRDDVMLQMQTGAAMRKSSKGYNVEYLNTMLGLFSAIIIVTYIMYTLSPRTYERLRNHHLYYTSIFVIAGLMRYLQITLVHNKAGSPTDILFKDRFIQLSIVLWVASFYVILYVNSFSIFK
jgi:decaprenyl-phosphate phosphoribosyltransferase